MKENFEFNFTTPIQGYDTVTRALQLNAYKQEVFETNSRLPRTIHFSSFWECPRRILLKARGERFTNFMFFWPNRLARQVGDMFHDHIQNEEFLKAGLLLEIPDSNEDEKIRTENRKLVKTQPAIEIDVLSWSTPFSEQEAFLYLVQKGIVVPEIQIHTDMLYYRMGGRLDMIGKFPYDNPGTPIEIKTTSNKYFPKTDKELEKLIKSELTDYLNKQEIFLVKLQHYIMQLQMQLHFIRNLKGERPKVGMIYLVNQNDINKRIPYFVEYSEQFVKNWLPVIREVAIMWENKIIPRGIPSKEDCTFCEYHDSCDVPDKFPRFTMWSELQGFNELRREAKNLYSESFANMKMVGNYITL